jgi:hypothetical protein
LRRNSAAPAQGQAVDDRHIAGCGSLCAYHFHTVARGGSGRSVAVGGGPFLFHGGDPQTGRALPILRKSAAVRQRVKRAGALFPIAGIGLAGKSRPQSSADGHADGDTNDNADRHTDAGYFA